MPETVTTSPGQMTSVLDELTRNPGIQPPCRGTRSRPEEVGCRASIVVTMTDHSALGMASDMAGRSASLQGTAGGDFHQSFLLAMIDHHGTVGPISDDRLVPGRRRTGRSTLSTSRSWCDHPFVEDLLGAVAQREAGSRVRGSGRR